MEIRNFKTMRISNIIYTLAILLAISGCSGGQEKGKTKQSKEANNDQNEQTAGPTNGFSIKRYEKALFSLDASKLEEGLKKLVPEYSIFLGDGNFTPGEVAQIKDFIADESNKEAYTEVIKQYPNLNKLNTGLQKAYKNYASETGMNCFPETYTYVSGFDVQYPVKYADTVMIIALDMYLGQDFELYKKMGIPAYISSRYTEAHILPDCIKEMAYPLIPEKTGAYTLLDAMIEQGKLLYFTQTVLPETPKELILGFSKAQLKWCNENESNLWQFIIENELLFSTESKAMSMFMVDGPFTSSFSQDSPARTGAWLGWQIVDSYMNKNKVALTTLTATGNSREILDKSGYKPKKK